MTLRLPGYSQSGFFGSLYLIELMSVAVVGLARHPSALRGAAILAIGILDAASAAVSAALGANFTGPLYFAGLTTVFAGLITLPALPRPVIWFIPSLIGGVVGAIGLGIALGTVTATLNRLP